MIGGKELRGAVLVVVAAMLVACSAHVPTPEPSSATSPRLTASPSLTIEPSPSSSASPADPESLHIAWSEVPFEGSLGAIAGDRSRFVAVGSVAGHGSSSWTSSDGITWERQEVPNKSFGEIAPGVDLTAGMGRLIRLGDTLYSFGGAEFMDAVLLAGWRWTDGGAWEVIDSKSGFFEGRVTALTASDEALLAGKLSWAGGLRGAYSTWLWTADTSWAQTGLVSTDEEDILVQDLAWNAGGYIAVGDRAERQGDSEPWEWPRTPAIWRSPDGRDWTAIRPPAGMSSVCTVAALPMGGFVALGSMGERPAVS